MHPYPSIKNMEGGQVVGCCARMEEYPSGTLLIVESVFEVSCNTHEKGMWEG